MKFRDILYEMPLDLTDAQRKTAQSSKRHVLVHMHPRHFLDLTTGSSDLHYRQKAKPLAKYNEYSHSGETLNSPFLYVGHDGKVSGHEGRHRAASLLKAKESVMPVHIGLRDHEEFGDTPFRELGWDHVPHRLVGQYSDREVHKKDLTLVQDKVASLK